LPISFLDVSNKILAHCHVPLKTITYKKYIQYIENATGALILSSIAKKKKYCHKNKLEVRQL
jgi:hypothetical protein